MMIECIYERLFNSMTSKIRKIVLEQAQSPGDILTASRGLYDFCRAYPDFEIDLHSPCPELFEHNPYTTPLQKSQSGIEVYNIAYDDINDSGWKGNHFADAFRSDIERKLNKTEIFSISIPVKILRDHDRIKQVIRQAFKQHWSPLGDDTVIMTCDEYDDDEENRKALKGLGGHDTIERQKNEVESGWMINDDGREYVLTGEDNVSETRPQILRVLWRLFGEVNEDDYENPYNEIRIPSTGIKPELYFSDEELSWYNQVHCSFFWDGPYWILNAGLKSDNQLKAYHRWQEVVDILNDAWQGKVRIVQIGALSAGGMSHIHKPLTGVFNLVGKTTTRELLRLAYWSTGIIGPISFQFVIGAANMFNGKKEMLKANIPNVVVAGGKEGLRWHVYNHVRWINKNGCLPCATSDGCWLGGSKGQCKSLIKPDDMDEAVPMCFEITSPEEIADAVFSYYNGGRLEMPEEELWHVPEGEDREAIIEKYNACYQEGVYPDEIS